jgi:hypothetical protein
MKLVLLAVKGAAHARRRTLAAAALALAAAPLSVAAQQAGGGGVTIIAAGDVAECPRGAAEATARLVEQMPGVVAVLGDEAYPTGSDRDFATCYAPTWGRFRARSRPVPGNHEYSAGTAAAYFRYFGSLAGPAGLGYYSYEAGAWHVVALNSGIDVGPASPQARWLRADLAAHPAACTLAYWHTPRFSSGMHGPRPRMAAFWQILYDAGADVVLSGHDHMYERFAPMDSAGRRDDARGIRQFVVGTGGAGLYRARGRTPNSQALDDSTHGVLRLSLERGRYAWEFVPVPGAAFRDAGRGTCHGASAAPAPRRTSPNR